jgi:hypothetical protein
LICAIPTLSKLSSRCRSRRPVYMVIPSTRRCSQKSI